MLTNEQIKERKKRFNKRDKNLKVAFIGLGFSILCYILWFLIVIITVLLGSFHVKIPPQAFFDDLAMWLPVYLASVGASIAGLAIIKNICDFIFSKDPTKFWKMDKQNTYVDLGFQKRTEEKYKNIIINDIQKKWENNNFFDIYNELCNKYLIPNINDFDSCTPSNVEEKHLRCIIEELHYNMEYNENIYRKVNNLSIVQDENLYQLSKILGDDIPSESIIKRYNFYDDNNNLSIKNIENYYYDYYKFKYKSDKNYKESKIPFSDIMELKDSVTIQSYFNCLISELTEKELAENRICYSPFREESDWQQREKENQEIIEYKEKYPWKNKYRKI